VGLGQFELGGPGEQLLSLTKLLEGP